MLYNKYGVVKVSQNSADTARKTIDGAVLKCFCPEEGK